ncbi:endonuclease V isoform X3 [Myiozetetes cayanensis]|uniref:endonuclease V isoform X3 n=1 Tax=Myiozetetes cayanensis TaxID=478635 RepID=UPI0021601A91|nr:endonuclease V isoform X3 [Myiozetetes cayanensis]
MAGPAERSRWEREQARLKAGVVEQDTEPWQKDPNFAGLERVGGVDLSYIKGDDTRACASLVVLSYPALEVTRVNPSLRGSVQVLYEDCRMVTLTAPYVAGFLAFREVPFLVEAVQRLQQEQPRLRPQVCRVSLSQAEVSCGHRVLLEGVLPLETALDALHGCVGASTVPSLGSQSLIAPWSAQEVTFLLWLFQVLLVDGNGVLHHRGFGVACHLGVLTDLPCVGVAKNLLQVDGLVRDELHREQIRSLQRSGDTFPLTGTSGRVLGMALRSYHNSSKPLYVSVGHRVSLDTAVRLVGSCCRYRVPEPIRQADIRSREYIRKQLCPPLEVRPAGPESKKEAELEDYSDA